MYQHQMESMVSQHTDELRRQAHLSGRHVRRPGPRNAVRHRAGWALIEIGLRLAGGPDNA